MDEFGTHVGMPGMFMTVSFNNSQCPSAGAAGGKRTIHIAFVGGGCIIVRIAVFPAESSATSPTGGRFELLRNSSATATPSATESGQPKAAFERLKIEG